MTPRERSEANPFLVLGVSVEAGRAEVERTGTRLLGMLELQLAAATTYTTPWGPRPRTADDVRAAMAELRDPEKRILHELWARVAPAPAPAPPLPPWPDAAEALGCSKRSSPSPRSSGS